MIKGIKQGIGIFLGFCATAIFAYTVSGTIKTWTSGENLTAADLNTTIQSLKTAVESASQVNISNVASTSGTNYYAGIPNTSNTATSEVGIQLPMPRDGVVKSIRVLPYTNTCTAASTLTLRKNGVDTAITFSIPASSLVAQTTSSTLSFVSGDVLTWKVVCATGNVYANIAHEF